MKRKKRLIILIVISAALLIVSFFNVNIGFIAVPTKIDMVSRQIDFITISTVFAGFSFTALGLLFLNFRVN